MNSGLYVRDGVCATARLAACAISLFGPTTNDSNVFRGLSPATLTATLLSRGDSGEISFKAAAFSIGICAAGPDGEEKFMPRGPPKVMIMAFCKAAM